MSTLSTVVTPYLVEDLRNWYDGRPNAVSACDPSTYDEKVRELYSQLPVPEFTYGEFHAAVTGMLAKG
ncbi:hypothetical protein [Mycolicibacterium lutetiense]